MGKASTRRVGKKKGKHKMPWVALVIAGIVFIAICVLLMVF